MTTKQYLSQISRFKLTINNKLSEIHQLESILLSVGLMVNEDRVQTSGEKDRLCDSVSRLVDLKNELNSTIKQYIAERERIISQIEGMEDEMSYQVLYSQYVEKKSFEEIADDICYSVKQARRIRDKALSEFEEKYGDGYKDKNLSLNVPKCP